MGGDIIDHQCNRCHAIRPHRKLNDDGMYVCLECEGGSADAGRAAVASAAAALQKCPGCGARFVPAPGATICQACIAGVVKKSARPWATFLWWAKASVALVAACGVGGFFHVVYGGGTGYPRVITKESWQLSDTFVDLDDYTGHSVLDIIGNGKAMTLRDLVRAGYIELPPGLGR